METPIFDERPVRDGEAGVRVANLLRAEILAGRILPGTRIRQEDLAERFGASRVPVREALRILNSEGLVTLVANTGAWVATLTLGECEEVYQMRERLEPLLLAYSAPHLTADDLAHLRSLADEMRHAHDVARFLDLDREFHLGTYRRAETSQLGTLVVELWNTTQPYRRAYTRSIDDAAWGVIHEEHNLLLVALEDGDVEEAGRVLASHIRRTRRRLARHPELFETFADDTSPPKGPAP